MRADPKRRWTELRRLLAEAVAATSADGILLSGGLDTSIVATLATSQGRRLRAVMVSVSDAPGRDEPFARLIAERLGIELEILRPRLCELLERMPEVISILKTFDPMELRNSIVTHVALQAAQAAGLRSVLTGDAADELFAGYSFMFNMAAGELEAYIRHLNQVMHFTSQPLAGALGLKAELPYLADRVRQFALTLEVADLVGERDGRRFGKKILRQAFADVLPEEIAWRIKTAIEFGSGSTALRDLAVSAIGDEEFELGRQRIGSDDGVRLRDKEQYSYYLLYRRLLAPPRDHGPGAKTCVECNGPVGRIELRYCRICGAFPI